MIEPKIYIDNVRVPFFPRSLIVTEYIHTARMKIDSHSYTHVPGERGYEFEFKLHEEYLKHAWKNKHYKHVLRISRPCDHYVVENLVVSVKLCLLSIENHIATVVFSSNENQSKVCKFGAS